MKKLLLLALLLMPTATFARVDERLSDTAPVDLNATELVKPIKPVDLEPVRIRPIDEPSEKPSEGVVSGGGNPMMYLPQVTSQMIHQPWLPDTTYQFLTGQKGFVYFERLDGTRIYEMDYATYHTIETDGSGTIYFVQVDKNGYEHKALKVLEIK